MKKLIIAEKPSVGRNIASALGGGKAKKGCIETKEYFITWAFGHLLQLYDGFDYDKKMRSWKLENFPFIPSKFLYKIKTTGGIRGSIDKGVEEQLNLISSLAEKNNVSGIILATDWDREGQIIGDEILSYLNIEKPVERLLLNEWTEKEVLSGLSSLKQNSEMISMTDAGFSRQQADWLIGINLTSVATVKYSVRNKTGKRQLLSLGRVILPTLKIIYDRDKEIENFIASSYFKLEAVFEKDARQRIGGENSGFSAVYYKNSSEEEKKGDFKFSDRGEAEAVLKEALGLEFRVESKTVKVRREKSPLLFNLSALQGHIVGKYKGWTGEKVLKIAQNLYEKKLITYPRTGSMVLDEAVQEKAEAVLNTVKKGLSYEKEIKFKVTKRIFDSSKVDSHSAIMPTYVKPGNLSPEEQIVYDAVKFRFIAQFMRDSLKEETKIILGHENIDGKFVAVGSVEKENGFKKAEKIGTKEEFLPEIHEGEVFQIEKGKVNTVTKKPPGHHSEKTLLKVMETCGKNFNTSKLKNESEHEISEAEKEEPNEAMMETILSGFSIGTPATRGETISKLKRLGYIEVKGKSLKTTPLGRRLVEKLPVKKLFDLDYTGRLEKVLSDIEKGKGDKEDFLKFIKEFTIKAVADIKKDIGVLAYLPVEKGEESLGECPLCGNPVVEDNLAFTCKAYVAGCPFRILKKEAFIKSLGKEVDRAAVKILLKKGRVGYKRLKSKKGNVFAAYIVWQGLDGKGRNNWKLEFIN